MTPSVSIKLDALGAVLDALRNVVDPRARLRAALAVRAELEHTDERLRSLIAAAIADLRCEQPKVSWREIGELLGGVSAQRAFQIAANEQPDTQPQRTP